MKILVTGGTGVLGAGAIPALLRAGHDVRLLSRHAERDVPAFPDGVEAFAADIADPKPLHSAIDGCAGVLHIAGIVEEQPPERTFATVNVGGTRHLVDAATEAGRPLFVFVSSLGAERGTSDYHRSKREAEAVVRSYAGPWIILRPGNIYGPGDETISMLLKMLRTLPAVPVVEDGAQPFQPLWFEDFGKIVVEVVERREWSERTLELAGPETTTTYDVLARLGEITGREPLRLEVPAWLARMGTGALEALGGWGERLLQRAGVKAPLNSAKLSLLLESNVLPRERNALFGTFPIEPTPLQKGLEQLVRLQPEQLPGEGVRVLEEAVYSAEIRDAASPARELIDQVCERLSELMPVEFAAESGAPARARESGETLAVEITGRGSVQVRLEERTDTRATFVTIDGHPLAGVLQFEASDEPSGLRFAVRTISQPANAFDWVALRAVGGMMQARNWRTFAERVVELSGGRAPDGVKTEKRALSEEEARNLGEQVRELVQRQQRTQRDAQVAS